MMTTTKLTKAVKEDIAKRAATDLFVPSLRERWKTVEEQFSSLVKDIFKDFDWEHVEPYRKFINWHDEIRLHGIPGGWQIHWDNFRKICDLPSTGYIKLSFKYPSCEHCSDYLDSAYKNARRIFYDLIWSNILPQRSTTRTSNKYFSAFTPVSNWKKSYLN